MKAVDFSALAVRDLREIAAYIRRDSPANATSFSRELRPRCAKIGLLPYAARKVKGARHELRIVPFKSYIIIYRVADDRVTVERIWHGSRDIPKLLAIHFAES
jgi:toxin ParE1/3/4